MMGNLAAIWGFLGVCALFLCAIFRLTPLALDLPIHSLNWYEWVSLIGCLVFMGVAEGYRGFQQNFSPRAAARLKYLKHNVTLTRLVFAPFFCMGYFHATRRRQIASICLTLGIVVLVVIVHNFSQPWRGIIDVGVVFGLAWGIVSLTAFTYKAFTDPDFDHPPETPVDTESEKAG